MSDKKHPCPDCQCCQWCSDDRCRLCLQTKKSCCKYGSISEQIARYEELNRQAEEKKKSEES
jgi:hypothetical protein